MIQNSLQITFNNDTEFASALCDHDKIAVAEFQDIYQDELYYISSRFCNRGTSQESWSYRTEKGYNINVDDNVADTYVWLVKNIVLNKSCHYKGNNGASFEAYIKTVLNSDYTFKDWLKWKTDDSLIKVPGATGYVPKAIKQLDSPCIEIYKLLRQNRSEDTILNKLDIEKMDYLEYYVLIEEALIDSKQISLINAPRFTSSELNYPDEDEHTMQISGETDVAPEIIPEVLAIKQLVEAVLENMELGEKKVITLWAYGYTADEIFNLFKTEPFLEDLRIDLGIEDKEKVFPIIEKIITKSVKYAQKDVQELGIDHSLNNKKMKNLLKTYFTYFS